MDNSINPKINDSTLYTNSTESSLFTKFSNVFTEPISLTPRNRTCENVIRYDGFEYVCYEKINFIVVMALILFILFIVFTVSGNMLVILAIARDKRLRTPSTYLILSLAVTDLIVGLVTVPIRAYSELVDYGTWPYGAVSCDVRVVIDKTCVYTSVLHLVAIALDRYLTVSSMSYSLTRSGKQILMMVSVAWGLSFLLSVAPMFGWRDEDFIKRVRKGSCFVNTLFSLNLTVWLLIFILPVIAILILYYRVFQVVKNRMKSVDSNANNQSIRTAFSTQSSQISAKENVHEMTSRSQPWVVVKGLSSSQSTGSAAAGTLASDSENGEPIKENYRTVLEGQKNRRERKAANTLVLITICVIVCWLPFFTMYTISSIFGLKFASTSNFWFKMTIWLGYFNSLLNPLIYAITNPYYREAFKRLLLW